MSDNFKIAVNKAHNQYLASNDYSEYFNLFNNYGTHILTKANYGCSIETYGMVTTNKVNLTSYDSNSFDVDISATIKGVSPEAASNGVFITNVEGTTERETGHYKNFYRGLNGATFNKWLNDYDEWEKLASDQNNFVLIDDPTNSFVPIWNYLKWSPNASAISSEFLKAYDEYEKIYSDYSAYEYSGSSCTLTRICGYKIHDTGRWEPENDKIFFDLSPYFSSAQLNDLDSVVTVSFDYSFRLVDDGYQYIFLYTSINQSNAILLYETELPGGVKKK
ncbi:MAG: MAC/perforin domain-containing protein [Anaeroplasmataceae bacterium]